MKRRRRKRGLRKAKQNKSASLDALETAIENFFQVSPTERKGSVHYLKFDSNPMPLGKIGQELLGKEEIIPAVEGYQEVATFLRASSSKEMVRNLIALAIISNRRRLIEQQSEPGPESEKES